MFGLGRILFAVLLVILALSCGLGAAPAAEPVDQHSHAYQDGVADRDIWDSWFKGLAGETRAGAAFWAGQRSAADPVSCRAKADGGEEWLSGCQDAKLNLDASDARRNADIQYRYGWNRMTITPGTITPGTITPGTLPRDSAPMTEAANSRGGSLGDSDQSPAEQHFPRSTRGAAQTLARTLQPDALALEALSGRDVNRLKLEFDADAGTFVRQYVAKKLFSDVGVFQEFAATALPASSRTLWMLVVNLPQARVTCFKDHLDPDLELLRRGQSVRVEGLVGIPMDRGIILDSKSCSADLF